MTVYVQILESPTPPAANQIQAEHFRPWLGCEPTEKDRELCILMAVQRHLRQRGGIAPDDHLDLTVLHYTSETPTGTNGRPLAVKCETFRATKP